MWFWLEGKMLHSPNKKFSQYTRCAFPPKSVPVVLHTHIYSLLLLLRWSEERLFMLPTVVLESGRMGGSHTEVREWERARERCWSSCTEVKEVFIFCPLPQMSWITVTRVSRFSWGHQFGLQNSSSTDRKSRVCPLVVNHLNLCRTHKELWATSPIFNSILILKYLSASKVQPVPYEQPDDKKRQKVPPVSFRWQLESLF